MEVLFFKGIPLHTAGLSCPHCNCSLSTKTPAPHETTSSSPWQCLLFPTLVLLLSGHKPGTRSSLHLSRSAAPPNPCTPVSSPSLRASYHRILRGLRKEVMPPRPLLSSLGPPNRPAKQLLPQKSPLPDPVQLLFKDPVPTALRRPGPSCPDHTVTLLSSCPTHTTALANVCPPPPPPRGLIPGGAPAVRPSAPPPCRETWTPPLPTPILPLAVESSRTTSPHLTCGEMGCFHNNIVQSSASPLLPNGPVWGEAKRVAWEYITKNRPYSAQHF